MKYGAAMTTTTEPILIQRLTRYAAAAATCADRYAKVFYPAIRNADEKFVCCVHGGEDMDHYLKAADVLHGFGVDLAGLVERPITERGLPGADVLEAARSWIERAVFSAVFEQALVIQLQSLAASDHKAIAKVAGAALPREEKHVAHGRTLLCQACSSPDTRQEAQAAVRRMLPVALAMLDTDEARAALVEKLRVELTPLGLSVSDGIS